MKNRFMLLLVFCYYHYFVILYLDHKDVLNIVNYT